MSTAAIGGTVGGLVFLGILVAFLVFFARRGKVTQSASEGSGHEFSSPLMSSSDFTEIECEVVTCLNPIDDDLPQFYAFAE
jgi:hypothetical protein